MATITSRRRKDGTTRYRAKVRIKRRAEVVYSESRTFGKKAVARDWTRQREEELEVPGALERVMHRGVSVGELIARYRYRLVRGGGLLVVLRADCFKQRRVIFSKGARP